MLRIERVPAQGLSPGAGSCIRRLCRQAYGEDLTQYLEDIGPGEHLVGWENGELVSHLMWVTRWLQPGDEPLLRTAYVELVATAPSHQRKGHATALLEYFPSQVGDFDLAALGPATEALYTRLGWRYWRGPLAVRTDRGLMPTPEERIMVLRLPRSPALNLDLPLSVEWRPCEEVW